MMSRSLIDDGTFGNKVISLNVKRQLDMAKKAEEEDVDEGDADAFSTDGDQLTNSYLRYNRVRREQYFLKKMKGPNFLDAIVAHHKPDLPDINVKKIKPKETDDQHRDTFVEYENSHAPEEVQIGIVKPGTMNTLNFNFESFDYTETSSALMYLHGAKRTALHMLRVNFNRYF